MKTLIKIEVIAIVVGFLCLNSISAQPPEGHKPPPIPNAEQIENMLDEMQEALSLSESQQQTISKMCTKHFEEVKVLMDQHKQQREQGKAEHDKLRKELELDVNEILNENQLDDYKAFVEAHKPKDRPRKE